jgi:hypothetical protein
MFGYELNVTVFMLIYIYLLYLILQWSLLSALTGLSSMAILFVQ